MSDWIIVTIVVTVVVVYGYLWSGRDLPPDKDIFGD